MMQAGLSRKDRFDRFKRPSLTDDIKNILQKYPDDGQIFKEIIQNAEDAGASNVVFVYDKNIYTNGNYFSKDGLKNLQGPSLYVYNDGKFSDEDWEGIRSLAISNKRTDPLKVGRFGLGFKSVFHLTDVPVISSGIEHAYLDPSKVVFDKEMEFLNFADSEDRKIWNKCSDFECYKKLPVNNIFLAENGYCNGTLLRFPLRKHPSEISSICYNKDASMLQLIDNFIAEGPMNMLFLKNVQSVKVCVIDEKGTMQEVYQVAVNIDSSRNYGKERKDFLEIIRKNTLSKSYKPECLKHHLVFEEQLKNGVKTNYSFILSEVYGYATQDDFRKLIEDEELSYVPLISIALPLQGTGAGHVFCGLPLPMREKCMTGLPVHVNGYFALRDDRSDLKWRTISKESKEKSALWNEHLIQKLLPLAYLNLMKFLLELNQTPEIVYAAWPDITRVNEKWKVFLQQLYQELIDVNCIFISSKKSWVNIKTAFFLQELSVQRTAVFQKFLELSNCNATTVPQYVYESVQAWAPVASNKMMLSVLKNNVNTAYMKLTKEEKCFLLDSLICSFSDVPQLYDVAVLPLCNGGYGAVTVLTNNKIYIPHNDHPAEVLPRNDCVVDISFFSGYPSLLNVLKQAANHGTTNLEVLDQWMKVVAALPRLISNSNIERITWNDMNWMKRFWMYQQRWRIPIANLENIFLLPSRDSNGLYLYKVKLLSKLMFFPSNFSTDMRSFLQRCGIQFVEKDHFDFQMQHDLSQFSAVQNADVNGIVTCISLAAQSAGEKCIRQLVQHSSHTLKEEIVNALGTCVVQIPSVFFNLELFTVHGGYRYSSINQLKVVDRKNIPAGVWISNFENIIEQDLIPASVFRKLQLNRWAFEDIIKYLLSHKHLLSKSALDNLYLFVIKCFPDNVTSAFLTYLREQVLIKTDNCETKASNLFRVSDRLKELFYGEANKFPLPLYDSYTPTLVKLGLRTEIADVTLSEIGTSINIVSTFNTTQERTLQKIKSILNLAKGKDLMSYYNQKWIPVKSDKPFNYPSSLLWRGKNCLEAPCNVIKADYDYVVGSCNMIVSDEIKTEFTAMYPKSEPSLQTICKHLSNVIVCYNDEERLSYKEMIDAIYKHMETFQKKDVISEFKRLNLKIWIGKIFVEMSEILAKPIAIGVEPYYFTIPQNLSSHLKSILSQLGVNFCELDVYINVLEKMMHKFDQLKMVSTPDLDLSVTLLTFISEKIDSLNETQLKNLCVPIEANVTQFRNIQECFYHDFDGERSYHSVSDYPIVHRIVGKNISDKFGIPNLVGQILHDGDDDLFESWGQGEPLVVRLKNILLDYEDGLAIPKELIQNADDAGATKVFFMYDERENSDIKSKLISPAMREWQGAALWVYNDSMFTEQDFVNITKLNVGTKLSDPSKIGKFGLGFNSVYHLTDVPSIISGKNVLILDPHTTNLGDAIKDKSKPGLRTNFMKKNKDLNHFSHQFKVYHAMFDMNFDIEAGNVSAYSGTLFRLPLRNKRMANQSKIKSLEYDNREMELLIKKLKDSLEHLLLFTQNVKAVEFFHLGKGLLPRQKIKLFSVNKIVSSSNNLVQEASQFLKQLNSGSYGYNTTIFNATRSASVHITVIAQDGENSESDWLITSCAGSKDLFEFASNNTVKGYNPTGAVALKFLSNSDGCNLPVTSETRYLYSFLPLPEPSRLPVHINGAFEVSNDRKHIVLPTIDEKNYGIEKTWNIRLSYDIGEAYYYLLVQLKSLCKNITFKKWLGVLPAFPLPLDNECIIQLSKSVWFKLINRNESIIPVSAHNGLNWVRWTNIVFMSKQLDSLIGEHAVSFYNWVAVIKKTEMVCVQPSKNLAELLNHLGMSNSMSYLNEIEFYKSYFQYINHDHLDHTLRNTILHILLKNQSKSDELRVLLSNSPCIPTQPSGNLKRPRMLVKEKSEIAKLFEIEDEAFPVPDLKEFSLDLEQLGMNVHKLLWDLILDRAQKIKKQSLQIKSCKDVSVVQRNVGIITNQSQFLIELIKHDISSCSEDIKQTLLTTEFLRVKSMTTDSPFNKWFSDGLLFAAPINLHQSHFEDLVCSSALVCSFMYERNIAEFLCLKSTPSFSTLCNQIINVIEIYTECDENKKIKFNDILVKIYKCLAENYIEEDLGQLSNLAIIFTEANELVKPCKVFEKIEGPIRKYLYKLPAILRIHPIIHLLQKLGVKSECEAGDYLSVMKEIHNVYGIEAIPENVLKDIIHHAVPFLCESNLELSTTIFLPDKQHVMRSVEEMCFKDVFWLSNLDDVILSHPDIPPASCLKLRVKPLRGKALEDASEGLDFGQHEDLCTRLKNILRGYSQEEDVLNEILQNADDAGATKVEFILDCRTHKSEKVFTNEWKDLQGPALLICNNGKFTKSDLNAIQNLGVGNKNTNALQTGKYGVGFNVVYQLTDCPSFITKIEEEDVLCVFDPHLRYVSGGTEVKPGRMFKDARAFLKNKFPDMTETYLFDEFESNGKTLFRLPLRNDKMAKMSKLSDNASLNKIKYTFDHLKSSSFKSLLFLKNVNILTFRVIDEVKASEVETFKKQSFDVGTKDLKEFKVFEKNYVANGGKIAELVNFKRILGQSVCLQHLRGNSLLVARHMHIIEQIGFANMESLPDEILQIIRENRLYLVPKGGVASLIDDTECERCEEIKKLDVSTPLKLPDLTKGVFCTLPLLSPVDLPIIINGNFVLDYETRRNLWSTQKGVEWMWNTTILNHCVLPCYIQMIEKKAADFQGFYESKECEVMNQKIEKYYKIFPKIDGAIADYFTDMRLMFYKTLSQNNHRILLVHNVNHSEVKLCQTTDEFVSYPLLSKEPYLELEGKICKPNLIQFLQKMHVDIDTVPKYVETSFATSGHPLVKCTPAVIRNLLIKFQKKILPGSEMLKIEDTVMKTLNLATTVLSYCLEKKSPEKSDKSTYFMKFMNLFYKSDSHDENKFSIEGLPLCVTADCRVKIFSSNQKTYFTRHSTLIDAKKNMFLHRDIYRIFNTASYNDRDFDCFMDFSIAALSNMLPLQLPKVNLCSSLSPIPFVDKEFVTKAWLKDLWCFVQTRHEKDGDSFLKEISSWSLLLCIKNNQEYLLPISDISSVLTLSDVEDSRKQLIDSLRTKIYVFESSYIKIETNDKDQLDNPKKSKWYIYESNFASKFFGSPLVGKDIIEALYYCHKRKLLGNLMNSQNIILSAICNSCDFETCGNDVKSKLKNLPLFERQDGSLVSASQKIIVLPTSLIPSDGLNEIENQSGYCFLKENSSYINLFTFLGFETCDVQVLYKNYIFPYFPHLTDAMIYKHMLYIRDDMGLFGFFCEITSNNQSFINNLRSLRFLPGPLGRKMACEYYDHNYPLFKLMLKDADFPPKDYQLPEWNKFLKEIGLLSELNSNLFLNFAKTLEKDLKIENALAASKLLCQELINDFLKPEKDKKFLYSFLKELKAVKFLIPNKLQNESMVNDPIEQIFKSKNSSLIDAGCQRICFENSGVEKHRYLYWTSIPIIPLYANISGYSYKVYSYKNESELGILTTVNNIPLDIIVSNLKNITNTLTKVSTTTVSIPKDQEKLFFSIMRSVYEYLKDTRLLAENLKQLKDICFVVVNTGNYLSTPGRSVLSLHVTIPPYLNEVHRDCSLFSEVFRKLGCDDKPTSKHYFEVLNEIYESSRSSSRSVLSASEQKSVLKSITGLAKVLKQSSIDTIALLDVHLYLATVTFQETREMILTKSSDAVYVDDYHLEKRLKHFTEKVLVAEYKWKKTKKEDLSEDKTNQFIVKHLPDSLKPKVLSKILREKLVEDSVVVSVEDDHISNVIQRRFESDIFQEILKRLIKHEQRCRETTEDVNSLLLRVNNVLSSISVKVLPKVVTYLAFNEVKIPESDEDHSIFMQVTKNGLEIYLSNDTELSAELFSRLSDQLIKLFKNVFIEPSTVLLLPLVLQAPLHNLPNILDKYGIFKDESESFLDYRLPEPGDLVPLELHGLLRRELVDFNVDDYVVIENLAEDGSSFYVYGIVKKIVSDQGNVYQRSYEVQFSRELNQTKEIKGVLLYSFLRIKTGNEDANTGDDVRDLALCTGENIINEEILIEEEQEDNRSFEEIAEEIKAIIRNTTVEDRKLVTRRLYLQWHPDKNPAHKKELATKVFQFIQNEIEKLKQGIEKNFPQWNTRASWEAKSNAEYRNHFRQQNRSNRRTNNSRQQHSEEYFGGSYHSSWKPPPTFKSNNPQPGEAKRWMRQARCDMESMKDNKSSEWICFSARQIAEKCLKASKYLVDYRLIDSHNLITIAAGLSQELSTLAHQLESLVVSSDHMLYPNKWYFPSIPNDNYTEDMANEAIILSTKIYAIVEKQIEQL